MKSTREKKPRILVFTDLDGTLLDHDTYDYRDAQEALNDLEEKGIPVIFCSSKTRAEMEPLRREMKNTHPFIVENGAALFIPHRVFEVPEREYKTIDGYQVMEMGISYNRIRDLFREIKRETGLNLRGFSEMSEEEIAKRTSLPLEKAILAQKREYTEPFEVKGKMTESRWSFLRQAVRRRNLNLTRGGRFYHLSGPNDKGKAVRVIRNLYHDQSPDLLTIGLGDGQNDFPMLEAVDIPVLIRKRNGKVEKWSGQELIFHSRGIGPKGWNEWVLDYLKEVHHE